MGFEFLALGAVIWVLIIAGIIVVLWLGGFALISTLFMLIVKAIVWIISIPLSLLGKKSKSGLRTINKSLDRRFK